MSSTSIKRYQTASPTGSYRINSYKHIQIYIKLHKYTNTYKYHQIPRAINRGPMHSHEEFFCCDASRALMLAGRGLLWFVVACCGNVWQCGELQPMVTVLNPGPMHSHEAFLCDASRAFMLASTGLLLHPVAMWRSAANGASVNDMKWFDLIPTCKDCAFL